jgi:hypothetical protein
MMATKLLLDLRRRGLVLAPEGTGVRVSPKSALTPELRETLRTHKADLLTALSVESRVLEMPLPQFEREGCPIEIRVPSFPETLWFVPGSKERDALLIQGIRYGRIWTARELMEVWQAPAPKPGHAQSLARIKVEFDAEVLTVESLSHRGDALRGNG